MSYSDFRLPDVIKKFSLLTVEAMGIFGEHPPLEPSATLQEILRIQVPIGVGVGNEKARSEFVIAPILAELKRRWPDRISVFSGVDLPADPDTGLVGTCDFLLSLTPEQAYVKAPVITVVEAKRDDLGVGVGQCVAEMVGAKTFNERSGDAIDTVYGAVTTGTMWRFMSLSGNTLTIDFNEYSINDIAKILGILAWMLAPVGGKVG